MTRTYAQFPQAKQITIPISSSGVTMEFPQSQYNNRDRHQYLTDFNSPPPKMKSSKGRLGSHLLPISTSALSVKKYIPRCYRKKYIPGWSETSEQLYQEFLETGNQEIAEELVQSLDVAWRAKWTETVESLDFKTSNLVPPSQIGTTESKRQVTRTTPNSVASHIALDSQGTDNTLPLPNDSKNL